MVTHHGKPYALIQSITEQDLERLGWEQLAADRIRQTPEGEDDALHREKSVGEKLIVKEAKTQAYTREKGRKSIAPVASKIASVKERLKKPAERSNRDIAWALKIAGIGEGPEDLSENTREYLHGHK